jgi:hypothetical protein
MGHLKESYFGGFRRCGPHDRNRAPKKGGPTLLAFSARGWGFCLQLTRPDYCTVRVVDPVVPPEFAPMVLVPAAKHCASPAAFCPLAIVDTLACDELQWLFSVTSCVVLSLNVPTAANCCVLPALHVGSAGETATDCNVPVPIVRVVVPCTPEAEAVIVTDPAFFPWAIPVERINARFGFEDFHDTPARLPPVLPSLNVPTAVNLIEVRTAIRGLAGLIVMLTRCAVETVNPVEPLTAP